MPRITVATNVFLNKERKYKMMVEMQKAIEVIPCESGAVLMTEIRDEAFMLFGEDDANAPCASIDIAVIDEVYDKYDISYFNKVMAEMTAIVSRYSGIPGNRIFAYFRNAKVWAYDGTNILDGLISLD